MTEKVMKPIDPDDHGVWLMTKFMDDQLKRGDGTFCMEIISSFPVTSFWNITMFRKFLKWYVQKGILVTEKDVLGRTWYRRTDD